MATLFSDGFESGNFSAWDSDPAASTATKTVSSTSPIIGSYSAIFDVAKTNEDAASSSIKNLMGVAQASVKKTSGVALASIKKVSGVSNVS